MLQKLGSNAQLTYRSILYHMDAVGLHSAYQHNLSLLACSDHPYEFRAVPDRHSNLHHCPLFSVLLHILDPVSLVLTLLVSVWLLLIMPVPLLFQRYVQDGMGRLQEVALGDDCSG